MGERAWEIGICGTFDVANYGDLLFPLIAESELRERLGAVTLHRFSYNCKTQPAWPFEVTSVAELPRVIDGLDGLLIGGGFLIRFDKEVAPGYAAPTPEVHHPTGYWLTPALMALQRDVPVVWNAPGTDGKDVPPWAAALMEIALDHSRYVAVRDEPSRSTLQALTRAPVAVVPDTAFGLARLWNLEGPPSCEFQRLCDASGLDCPYIVIQAKAGFEGFVRFVKKNAGRFSNFRFLALPIGPALSDREDFIDADLPGIVRLAEWPSPLVIAELIARSEAVIGYSYHLCITALAAGVPVFAWHDLPMCKYSALHKSDAFFVLPPDGEPELEGFLARLGRTTPSAMARDALHALRAHWDSIAGALRAEKPPTSPALNRFWQSLPALLEEAGPRESAAANEARWQLAVAQDESDRLRERLDDTVRQLSVARAQTAARDARITDIMTSLSWRLTAPLRIAARQVLKHRKRRIINLDSIRHHKLKTDPYQ
jgi:lipopolysaccharide transport system ATP-binding protein